jgi:hypothetical protein
MLVYFMSSTALDSLVHSLGTVKTPNMVPFNSDLITWKTDLTARLKAA